MIGKYIILKMNSAIQSSAQIPILNEHTRHLLEGDSSFQKVYSSQPCPPGKLLVI